ncbi:nitrite reductase small subunit NirD [Sphingobacterium populi]|uniref:nitrite reductase small subunit NirD n=1 Tax=Sphingobacterium sp. CFCC 11742 TaxID=1775560 RepID=UPI00082A470C|nr:nitrite reductase small subunit NirD [Sphingobacterium sp. CFCC 11742]
METMTTTAWELACHIDDTIENGGVCVQIGGKQIALFYFKRRNEWYATQNECPHKKQMILSRGMTGSLGDTPKVACPFHKKTFALDTGECLSGDECAITTYPVKVEAGLVYISLEN